MGVHTNTGTELSVLSSMHKKLREKKKALGGPMAAEEIRMNKELLKEINQMKK